MNLLRRRGFFLLREGPGVQFWVRFRRRGGLVLLTAIMRGTPGERGNVPSTVWRLSVLKHFNARQRRELRAMIRANDFQRLEPATLQ